MSPTWGFKSLHLHHTECSYRTLKFLYVTRFFYCFFSMRIFRYQAIQLLCKFTASKNRSSIKAFHLYSERSFFSLSIREISIFYFKFSTIRINTDATCALVVFAFGTKLPSVLPVITNFSAAHITAFFA